MLINGHLLLTETDFKLLYNKKHCPAFIYIRYLIKVKNQQKKKKKKRIIHGKINFFWRFLMGSHILQEFKFRWDKKWCDNK